MVRKSNNSNKVRHLSDEYTLNNFSLDSFDVISVDLFDTLVFRTCKTPEDIFPMVGTALRERGVFKESLFPEFFGDLRVKAQSLAYRNLYDNQTDPSLLVIYGYLKNFISNLSEAIKIEIEIEFQNCYLNPFVFDLLLRAKKRHKKIVIASDTYLSEEILGELLRNLGVHSKSHYDVLMSSFSLQKSKRTGSMYQHIREVFPTFHRLGRIIHLGDNYSSDFLNAKSNGFAAIYYRSLVTEVQPLETHENIYQKVNLGAVTPLRRLNVSCEQTDAFVFGSMVLAPFFVAFSDWVVERCKCIGLRKILVFMRDGEVLAPLIQGAARRAEFDCHVEKIWVSRESTFFVQFKKFDYITFVFWMQSKIPLGYLLGKFDILTPDNLISVCDVALCDLQHVVGDAHKTIEIQLFDLLSCHSENIDSSLARYHEEFKEYIFQFIDESEPIALVDHSHKCTVGLIIARFLGHCSLNHPEVVNFISEGDPEVISEGLLEGFKIECFIGGPGSDSSALSSLVSRHAVIEELFYPDIGTVYAYVRSEGGKVRPTHREYLSSDNSLDLRADVKAGIFSFSELWTRVNNSRTHGFIPLHHLAQRDSFLHLLLRVFSVPTEPEARLLGAVFIDKGYGSRLRFRATDPAVGDLKRTDDRNASSDLSCAYWPEAVLFLESPAKYLKACFQGFQSDFKLNPFLYFYIIALQLQVRPRSTIGMHGAGKIGVACFNAIKAAGLELSYVSDNNTNLIGNYFETLEICSLDEMLQKRPEFIFIGSVANCHNISRQISELISAPYSPLIIDVGTPLPY